MKCFVTGASGFIGSNVVKELLERGHRVKALVRQGSNQQALADLKVEIVRGDLFDRHILDRELAGCDWCFHIAASYHLWMRNYASMYSINVDGTRSVLESAGKAGCSRIVYTSTVGCIGLPVMLNGKLTPSTECDLITPDQLTGHYKISKFKAESVAMECFHKKGIPVVIVNPSAPVGPGDLRPTPTGKIIVDFLNRKLPGYVAETGLNWVHVKDVAVGHVEAAERGSLGERYILGNAQGNWTMEQTLATLEKVSGVRAPKRKIPHWVAVGVAQVSEFKARFTGKEPQATRTGVEMAKHKMWFNPYKAIRDIRLPQTPPEQAFADAVEWFRKNGYAKS